MGVKMKRFIIVVLEIIICFLLQTTVFHWISLANAVPNLLLILTVSAGLMRGRMDGLAVGFFCGLMIDFCFSNILGLFAFIYMLIGYLNGYSNKIFEKDDLTIPIILIAVSDLLYFFLYYVFEFLLRGKLNIFFYFIKIGLPELIYTVLISILLYKLLNIIHTRISRSMEKEA